MNQVEVMHVLASLVYFLVTNLEITMSRFDESVPSYRFIKSFGVLTALLEYVGVPRDPFKSLIKEAEIPLSLAGPAKKAYEDGRESAHLAIDKDSFGEFSRYYFNLQESMTRDLSLWNSQAAPRLKSIKPSYLWNLRRKRQ